VSKSASGYVFPVVFDNIDISLESLILADCMYRDIQILTVFLLILCNEFFNLARETLPAVLLHAFTFDNG